MPRLLLLISALLCGAICIDARAQSECFGNPYEGSVEKAVQLPSKGTNFVRLSMGPVSASRVYVHSTVSDIVLDAYRAMSEVSPDNLFVYGETGLQKGGPMPPHRTHRNGTSVDFFVPVVDANGKTTEYPHTQDVTWGYGVTFNYGAHYKELSIDFEAMAEHIYQLQLAAKQRGADIGRVIFDKGFVPRLLQTKRGSYLARNVTFLRADASDPHDQHYHVDFAVACK